MKRSFGKKNDRRVVVTGLGVVSSIGIGKEKFWKNLIAGKTGISRISSFDTTPYDRHYGGEVKDFNPEEFISKRKVKRIGRASQMAIAASKLALKDSNLSQKALKNFKSGVCIGTTAGEQAVIEGLHDLGRDCNETEFVQKMAAFFPSSSISSNVAIELGVKSSNVMFSTACASGNYALAKGFDLIQSGRADVMLVGGADAFSRLVFTGFSRLFAVAPDKCQPFDKNRKGMIPGEGSGILVIESLAMARLRGAKIYAEILGHGMSCDAKHMTNPDEFGVSKAMHKAIKNSGISSGEIDYISAHGTGTKENDKAECAAISRLLNGASTKVSISSIKSMLGHTMGSASALESIACCLAVKNNRIPPTINFEDKDSECDIDCTPNKSQKKNIKVALNNSQAFGGNNIAIIFEKLENNE